MDPAGRARHGISREEDVFRAWRDAGGIATNILADRLKRLEAAHIIRKRPDPNDGRSRIYALTQHGLGLVPILLDLMVWSREHTPKVDISKNLTTKIKKDRAAALAEILKRLE